MAIPGRTVDQIAAAIGCPDAYASMILAELERDGLAEQVDARWRLSSTAEARFGPALRGLPVSEWEAA